MKNVLFVLVALLTFPSVTKAEYLPGRELLAKMERMLQAASLLPTGKEVRAGTNYKEGDVAVFAIGLSGDVYWQFEEWRMQPNGYFLVRITNMWPARAERWELKLSPSGTLLREGISSEEVSTAAQEVIEASERAQELLLRYGRPVILGGTEI